MKAPASTPRTTRVSASRPTLLAPAASQARAISAGSIASTTWALLPFPNVSAIRFTRIASLCPAIAPGDEEIVHTDGIGAVGQRALIGAPFVGAVRHLH